MGVMRSKESEQARLMMDMQYRVIKENGACSSALPRGHLSSGLPKPSADTPRSPRHPRPQGILGSS